MPDGWNSTQWNTTSPGFLFCVDANCKEDNRCLLPPSLRCCAWGDRCWHGDDFLSIWLCFGPWPYSNDAIVLQPLSALEDWCFCVETRWGGETESVQVWRQCLGAVVLALTIVRNNSLGSKQISLLVSWHSMVCNMVSYTVDKVLDYGFLSSLIQTCSSLAIYTLQPE